MTDDNNREPVSRKGKFHIDPVDDLRQSFVIAKNEIKKFFRGKKILIFGILILSITLLLAVLPYAFGDQYNSKQELIFGYITFTYLLIELAGVLFTATSLVSEFEDRTALILFTKPVRKGSIFVGKLMASLVVICGFTLCYYLFITLFALIVPGEYTMGFVQSLALTLCGIFGISGLAMFMSSFAKKGSTASILTFVMLMLLLSLISGLLNMYADIDPCWDLTNALGYIVIAFDPSALGMEPVTTATLYRSAAVMLTWGVVCSIIAFFIFRRRDF